MRDTGFRVVRRLGTLFVGSLLAIAVVMAGCGSTKPAELRFESETTSTDDKQTDDEAIRHRPETDSPDTTTTGDDPSSDLATTPSRGEPNPSDIQARVGVGDPPLAGPFEVATAITPEIGAFTDATLTDESDRFPNPTQFGGPRVFRVLDSSSHENAIQVSLPIKPNGQTGWIARDSVELTSIDHQVLVNLADDSITVWNDDEVVTHALAVTGTRWTPTPTGIFFMRDVIRPGNPNGSYGSRILALSGFSDVLDSFAGGLPAIAIHGTNRPDTMGQERSNGCVRVPNELIEQLAKELPLGTPVTIVSSATSSGFDEPSGGAATSTSFLTTAR